MVKQMMLAVVVAIGWCGGASAGSYTLSPENTEHDGSVSAGTVVIPNTETYMVEVPAGRTAYVKVILDPPSYFMDTPTRKSKGQNCGNGTALLFSVNGGAASSYSLPHTFTFTSTGTLRLSGKVSPDLLRVDLPETGVWWQPLSTVPISVYAQAYYYTWEYRISVKYDGGVEPEPDPDIPDDPLDITLVKPNGWKSYLRFSTSPDSDSPSPATFKYGETVYLNYSIVCNGAIPHKDFHVRVYCNGWESKPVMGFTSNTFSKPGEPRTWIGHRLGGFVIGTQTVRLVIDEENRVAETNEDNNEFTATFSVVGDPRTLTLYRNNSGGDGACARRTVAEGEIYTLPTIASLGWTRSGYTFFGWAEDRDATNAKCGDGARISITSDLSSLYAVWKKNETSAQTYIVRLHRNNSERDGSTAGRTYTIGKARALPKIRNELKWAPRTGYDFLGWAKTADATTATYTDGQSLKDLTKTAGATVHLYAVWKVHKYIVRLHRNNSKNDGATTGRAFDYDQVRFLPTMAELKWVRSGYMFLGWSQAQSSTTVKYADGLNVFNLSANDGEELHIWGVWKKAEANAYLLRLHRNNSERDGATAGRQLKLNTNRKLPTVKELGWARTDATFKGWATTVKNAAAGKVAYKDGATVKNLVSTQGDTAHIYAVWK